MILIYYGTLLLTSGFGASLPNNAHTFCRLGGPQEFSPRLVERADPLTTNSINVTINAAQDIDITIGDGLKDSLNNVISQVQCQSKRTKRVPGLDTECRQRVETAILDLIMGTPLQGNAGALARVPRRDAPPADDYGFLMASVLPFGTANLIELQKAVLLAVTIAEEVVIRAVEIELTRLQLQLLDTTFRILGEWLEDKKGECPANAPIGINAPSCADHACGGVSGKCSTGTWKDCGCVQLMDPVFIHPMDQATFDYVKPDGPQDQLLDEIANVDSDPKVDCKQQRSTKRNAIPENYCECDGKKYVAVSNEPDAACPYHTESELPDPLPVSDALDQSDQIKIVVTQTQRISSVLMNNATVILETASGFQLGSHHATFSKTLRFGAKYFKGSIRMDAVAPTIDHPMAEGSDLKFRQGLWYNITYMPIPDVAILDPAHQKSAIRWASNSADGKESGVQLPGFGCDDLTAIPWKGHATGTSLVTRVFHCWFQPVR